MLLPTGIGPNNDCYHQHIGRPESCMLDNNHEIGVLTTVLPPQKGLLNAKVAHNEVGNCQ